MLSQHAHTHAVPGAIMSLSARSRSKVDLLRPYQTPAARLLDEALLRAFQQHFLVYVDTIQHLADDYSFSFSANGVGINYTSVLSHTYGVRPQDVAATSVALMPKGSTHLISEDGEPLDPDQLSWVLKLPGQQAGQTSRYAQDIDNQLFRLMTCGFQGKPFFPVLSIRSLRRFDERMPSIYIDNLLIDQIPALSPFSRNNLKQHLIEKLFGERAPAVAQELLSLHVNYL